nr:pentapeptide repeat-containing protein [uncultured Psychroserpens sp.]
MKLQEYLIKTHTEIKSPIMRFLSKLFAGSFIAIFPSLIFTLIIYFTINALGGNVEFKITFAFCMFLLVIFFFVRSYHFIKRFPHQQTLDSIYISYDECNEMEHGEFSKILREHQKWLNDDKSGQRAIFEEVIISSKTVGGLGMDGRGLLIDGSLSKAEFNTVIFKNVEIHNFEFRGSDFEYVKFENVISRLVHYDGSSFSNCILEAIQFSPSYFDNCNITWVSFCESDLNSCKMKGAEITLSLFEKSKLTGVDFSDSLLNCNYGIDLDLNTMKDTKFRYVQMRGLLNEKWGTLLHFFPDKWTLLRRYYSGSKFMINLFLILLFIVPYLGKNLYEISKNEISINYYNSAVSSWIEAGIDMETKLVKEYPNDGQDTIINNLNFLKASHNELQIEEKNFKKVNELLNNREVIDKLKSRVKELKKGYSKDSVSLTKNIELISNWEEKTREFEKINQDYIDNNFKRKKLWFVLLGLHEKGLAFLLILSSLLYNILRLYLTYKIAPLKDEETRSQVSPMITQYKGLFEVHCFNSSLIIIVVLSGLINLYQILNTSVWI